MRPPPVSVVQQRRAAAGCQRKGAPATQPEPKQATPQKLRRKALALTPSAAFAARHAARAPHERATQEAVPIPPSASASSAELRAATAQPGGDAALLARRAPKLPPPRTLASFASRVHVARLCSTSLVDVICLRSSCGAVTEGGGATRCQTLSGMAETAGIKDPGDAKQHAGLRAGDA